MKTLLAILCVAALGLGGVFLLATLAGVDLDLDAQTTDKCTTGPPAGNINYESCTGSEEGSGQLALAVFGGSSLITGGLLAVASVGVQGRRAAAAPPAWTGQGH